jgi:hypothetical protein
LSPTCRRPATPVADRLTLRTDRVLRRPSPVHRTLVQAVIRLRFLRLGFHFRASLRPLAAQSRK